jgi:hypothetical protein
MDKMLTLKMRLTGLVDVEVRPRIEMGVGQVTYIETDATESDMVDIVHHIIEWIGKDAVQQAVNDNTSGAK